MSQKKLFTVHLDDNMIKQLINAGFYEKKYKDLLKQAIDLNNIDIIQYILDKKILNIKNPKYLFYAIIHGNLNILQVLLDHGANPNKIDYEDLYYKAFYYRVHSKIPGAVKLFLTYGLEVSKILSDVIYFHDTETLIPIIPHISKDNIKIHDVLDCLIHWGTVSDVKCLLDRLNSPKLLNSQHREHGDTALHYSVRKEHNDMVKVLLFYGADFYIKNNDDFTARDLAHSLKYNNMVSILRSYEDAPTIKCAED